MGLAKGGFGEQLAEAIETRSGRDLQAALHLFREDIRHQMRTNERGLFERKAGAIASKIPETWPDVTTAKRYYTPVTSAVPQYAGFRKSHTWSRTISIPAITNICDELFEFTHPEILQK
jgi:Holliday junction resolvase YEN1